MKKLLHQITFTLALAAGLTHAAAQGTAITYQGRLSDNLAAANGSYDLIFSLFNVSSGGAAAAGPIAASGVAVSNGLFTVVVDFGSGVFNGIPYWLEIGVRTNGGASYTNLSPRQQITPAPYAIFAEGANAAGLSGTVSSTLNFNPPSGPPFAVGNTNVVTGLNADLLDGRSSSAFWQVTGNAGTGGTAFLGTTDGQPLDLRAYNSRGLRLQYTSVGSLYSSASSVNVIGGYQNNYIPTSVVGGTIAGGGDYSWSIFFGATDYTNTVSGNFGAVGGGYNNDAGFAGAVPGGYNNTASGSASFAAGANANATNNHSFVWSDGTAGYSSGDNCFDIFASGGLHINQSDLYLRSGNDRNHGIGYRSTFAGIGVDGPVVYGWSGGALAGLGPDTIALKWDWTGNVWVSNNCSVGTLTVRGGADVAEPFPVAGGEAEPGTVMVIDEDHPGHLTHSCEAYDTRVAGVISGAGGVHPGLELHQDAVLDQGQKLALTGRVYVKADASKAPIKPGDLLTTSDRPGYAMKVTDHARAQGAILGKAMTGLRERDGLVLVLVTLQ